MHIASERCVITVNTIGRPVLAAWYMIYLAATAIDAMCVRRGLVGVLDRLGKSRRYLVPLKMARANRLLGSDGSLSVTVGDRSPQANIAAFS